MKSNADTVDQYLAELPEDRREALEEVRQVILDNLPDGYEEGMSYGMIGYYVPLETYPDTYNGQPLGYAALASQKHHMAVYLTSIYGDASIEEEFRRDWLATGKKLDMGKSCVRFKRLEDLPLEVIGRAIASLPVDEFVAMTEAAHRK